MKNLGNAIKKLRELKGLRRQHLADEVGVSLKTLGNIENNISSPNIETLEKIGDILGVSVLNLYRFDEKVVFNNNEIQSANIAGQQHNPKVIDHERELYEKLIAEKDQHIRALEQQISLLVDKKK